MAQIQLQEGQFYRNSANHYFKIEALTDTGISLREYKLDGPAEKLLKMNRNSFEALLKNKNYDPVKNYGYDEESGRWKERGRCISTEARISANRYMV